ncbi:MAG: hypothetical protein CMM95_01805 [Rickettsiales bacterium]|nr:hypothetical protein [Rickettsiales bacterium]
MEENKANNFLIKIEQIRKASYASSLMLKPDDVIVALNNQFYTYGEKKLTEELRELKKENEKALLTVLRDDVFFDVIINGSLGCKFLTTNTEETENIKKDFSKKENYDIDQLKDYVAMRDVYRRYDIHENSKSLSAGLFPPLWLSYSKKWWVLFLFLNMSGLLLAINGYMFLLGWALTSLYCYQAQLNLLYSFSMLEGKVFSMKLATKSIDEAHKIIRKLDPKSRFMYSRLEDPVIEDSPKKEVETEEENQNIVSENKEALV